MPECTSCKRIIDNEESDNFNSKCVACYDVLYGRDDELTDSPCDEILDSDLEDRDYGQERFE